jgi:putative ABC transport system permease protein
MIDFQIAVRNLMRNGRRSAITVFAIIVGMVALLMFGGYIASIYYGLQTGIVRTEGHLHIYPKGYLEYGFSRPTDFYISDYDKLIEEIKNDASIKDKLRIVTPIVTLAGIAGNYSANSSTTFIGVGLLPSDHNRMRDWDAHHLNMPSVQLPLSDQEQENAVIGHGMARMLNLCKALAVSDCQDIAKEEKPAEIDAGILAIQESAAQDIVPVDNHQSDKPSIDLLGSTGSGAPNAISLVAVEAQRQGVKVLDDSFVGMHLHQAQRLIYGDQKRVSAIVLQLHDTNDMAAVQTHLADLFAQNGDKLEIKNYTEFNPEFNQIINMFVAIFTFMVIVIILVVLFTIINTLTMSVMERIDEIGSLRALGLRRSGVRRLFLLEGVVIGFAGATLGLAASIIAAHLFNNAGYTWSPPNSTTASALEVLPFKDLSLVFYIWLVMIMVAAISSLLPARRAARMNIVDAIRHV